jgi:serine/threonine-protein kinase RsbW/sigma-B regulation protein RsbU (phosphoserine phosphatase)
MDHLITLPVEEAMLSRLDAALGDCFRRDPLPEPVRLRLRLILEELATNTLHYGACPGSLLEIRLRREAGAVLVDYRDRGVAFDPTREVPAEDIEAPLEERRIGGLGWPLIRAWCDAIAYRHEAGANCLQLRLPASA